MARTATMLILMILGHVLLMASSTDVIAAPHSTSPAGHVAPAAPALSVPAYDDSCFTVQSAVTPAPLTYASACSTAVLCHRLAGDMLPFCLATTSPYHPPNVVRALLQVYRI